jgi:hypothetical protein
LYALGTNSNGFFQKKKKKIELKCILIGVDFPDNDDRSFISSFCVLAFIFLYNLKITKVEDL